MVKVVYLFVFFLVEGYEDIVDCSHFPFVPFG